MLTQTAFSLPCAEQDTQVDARQFWSNLGWDVFCFPENYPNLIQQHRDAGLAPEDEKHLDAEPWGRQRPTTFTSRGGRTVSID